MAAAKGESEGRGVSFWAAVAAVVIAVAAVAALAVRVVAPEGSSAYFYIVHNHMALFFWTLLVVAFPVYIMLRD